MPYQKLIYPCPFCDKETLEVIYRPSYKAAKRSQSVAAGSKTWRRVQEGITLISEKCPNCGKSAKEIERKWKGELKNRIISDTAKAYKPYETYQRARAR
ncbi:MAG: hypothetical protein QW201_02385 [Thermoproteota archaeon]